MPHSQVRFGLTIWMNTKLSPSLGLTRRDQGSHAWLRVFALAIDDLVPLAHTLRLSGFQTLDPAHALFPLTSGSCHQTVGPVSPALATFLRM